MMLRLYFQTAASVLLISGLILPGEQHIGGSIQAEPLL